MLDYWPRLYNDSDLLLAGLLASLLDFMILLNNLKKTTSYISSLFYPFHSRVSYGDM